MIRIGIPGVGGRMGERILALAGQEDDVAVSALFERDDSPLIGTERIAGKRVLRTQELASGLCDVLIDFTAPAATLGFVKKAAACGIAHVIGTTGFSAAQKEEIARAARAIPILMSPNMSLGVNAFFQIVALAARVLPEFNAEIIEAHHNKKKDAPSGTALRIAEEIAHARGLDRDACLLTGRSGTPGERTADEIGIHAVRAGDIVGEHTALFAAGGECIELTHRAYTRDIFVRGAIAAARWLVGRKPGLYAMTDVISSGK